MCLVSLNPSGGIITALNDLGDTSLQEGDPHQAASFFQEALTLGLETGDKPGIASNLVGLASVFLQLGKTDRWRWAVRLLGQAEIVLETSGVNTGADNQTQIEATCIANCAKSLVMVYSTARGKKAEACLSDR